MISRPRRGVVVAALALLLASCGLGQSTGPHSLPADDVPFDLLAPRPSTTTTSTTTPPALAVDVTVYLVDRDRRLQPVRRTLPQPITVIERVEALLGGPTDEEAAGGLRSAVQSEVSLIEARVEGAIVTLNFSEELALVEGEDRITAIAQLVFTATEVPGITAVSFELAGTPLEAPRGDGAVTSAPLTRIDHAERGPRGADATPTTSTG